MGFEQWLPVRHCQEPAVFLTRPAKSPTNEMTGRKFKSNLSYPEIFIFYLSHWKVNSHNVPGRRHNPMFLKGRRWGEAGDADTTRALYYSGAARALPVVGAARLFGF